MSDGPLLSIVVPCLNEAGEIAATLEALQAMRDCGAEIIVVDGGSNDETARLARQGADVVLSSAPGRARQMNAGAQHARGDVLLFLHADTRLPRDAHRLVMEGLARSGRGWGRFDVTITGSHGLLRVIAAAMNWRSRLTGIATGDQALFMKRLIFEDAGRYPDIALMEDIALTTALRRTGLPLCLTQRVTTSGRRWEEHGVIRVILLMWQLRFAYWCGASPERLARRYATHRAR